MKHIAIIIAILALAVTVYAKDKTVRGTTTQVGNTQYHRFSDGTRGTTTQVGNTQYHRFSDGTRATTTKTGNTTQHRIKTREKSSYQKTPAQFKGKWYDVNSD